MRASRVWMRSTVVESVVWASGCQSQSCDCPGFDPSILRRVEFEGLQMKQCWITYIKRKKPQKSPFLVSKKKGEILHITLITFFFLHIFSLQFSFISTCHLIQFLFFCLYIFPLQQSLLLCLVVLSYFFSLLLFLAHSHVFLSCSLLFLFIIKTDILSCSLCLNNGVFT